MPREFIQNRSPLLSPYDTFRNRTNRSHSNHPCVVSACTTRRLDIDLLEETAGL